MANIIIENKKFCLTLGTDCIAKSLIHKASGQECLDPSESMSLFSVTQARPYNNEIKLAYPNKRTTYQANRVRRDGNQLLVQFEIVPIRAVITLKETDDYISFCLDDFIVEEEDYYPDRTKEILFYLIKMSIQKKHIFR